MGFIHNDILCCPLDQLSMQQRDGYLVCENGHSYDIARQGYVNLLAASDKRSKDPGDSKSMVRARHDFFEAGYYQPVAQHLTELVTKTVADGSIIVDAGCGEGYYLQCLQHQLQSSAQSGCNFVGFDISKWAVAAAARRCPATWFVASNRNIPISADSVDILISLFGFPAFESFRRILKNQGLLILANAGPRHLIELREIIYTSLKNTRSTELEQAQRAGFVLQEATQLTYQSPPLDQAGIAQLLEMTPHLYRATREGKEKLSLLQELAVTVDVQFQCLTHP